jgi:hypothetical protein
MRPFNRVLYAAYTGRAQNASVTLDTMTRLVITLFRMLFVMVSLQPGSFATSFDSFHFTVYTWVCEFDASLEGIGIIWYQRRPDGQERAVMYTSVDITALGFAGKPEFQNTAEYLGSLFCILGLAVIGQAAEPCLFRGDSMSALTWVDKGSVKSTHAIRAAMLWAHTAVRHKAKVTGTTHLAGKVNTCTDCLSREGTWAEVLVCDWQRHGSYTLPASLPRLDFTCAARVLDLCNPALPLDTEAQFTTFLKDSRSFLDEPLGMCQPNLHL